MSEADNVWRVQVDGVEHEVELDHGTVFGRRVITVDGVVVVEGQKVFDTGSTHAFQVDGQPAEVKIEVTHAGFAHASSLHVAGRYVEPLRK